MKYRNYKIKLARKIINNSSTRVIELKSSKDYIFYIAYNLNLITEHRTGYTPFNELYPGEYKKLIKQLKLIVDKRIIEKTIFNLK